MISIDYHLQELAIANSPADPRHIMPPVAAHRWILDVGCGAGQTLMASNLGPGVKACGVDPDLAALSHGRQLSQQLWLACGNGEHLPFKPHSFDLVACRVALPYMHIQTALAEIGTVLKPGGDLWLTLHPPAMILKDLLKNVSRLKLKRAAAQLCVLVNGTVWHCCGKQLTVPFSRYPLECFQTVKRMNTTLRDAGFENIRVRLDRFFVMTATKSGA